MALESQGTTIAITNTAVSPNTDASIGSVVDFTGPGGAASVIDITTLASSAKEKMMGLPDEGQLALVLLYDPTDTNGQVALRSARAARTKETFKITFNDSPQTIATFSGYVLTFSIKGAVDDKVSADVTIEIDGAVTWA